jgi:hypothetical protein
VLGASTARFRNSCVAVECPDRDLEGEGEEGEAPRRDAASMGGPQAHGPSSWACAGLLQDPAL